MGAMSRVGVLAADGEAGCAYTGRTAETTVEVPLIDAHAVKLRAMIGRCDGWMGVRRGPSTLVRGFPGLAQRGSHVGS